MNDDHPPTGAADEQSQRTDPAIAPPTSDVAPGTGESADAADGTRDGAGDGRSPHDPTLSRPPDAYDVPSILASSITSAPGKPASESDATLTQVDDGSDRTKDRRRHRGGSSRAVRPNLGQQAVGARLDIDHGVDLPPASRRSRRTKLRPTDTSKPSDEDLRSDSSQDVDESGDSSPDPVDTVTIDDRPGSHDTSLARRGSAHKYAVETEIARGGMGAVFRVIDTDIRRPVAMKVMIGDPSERHRVMRFLEEVQITGQLEHPNIVPVHDVGLDEDHNLYFTMKLVAGEPLSTIIRRLREGRMYRGFHVLNRRLEMFLKVCDAIGFAHSRGVIHRDIKPPNIMVGDYGEVQVMDWGLARVISRDSRPASGGGSGSDILTDRREAGTDVTLAGTVAGTPTYMPPEQARGEIDAIDERADIYSLGALLYELLVLRPPFEGESAVEILRRVVDGKLVPPRERAPQLDIPRELEAIVLKAMTPRKAGRFKSVEQLKEELQRYIDGHTLQVVSYSGWERLQKAVRRNRAFVAGLAAALILAVVVGFFFWESMDRARREQVESAAANGRAEVVDASLAQLQSLLEELGRRVSRWEQTAALHETAMARYHHARAELEKAGPASPDQLARAFRWRATARRHASEALHAHQRLIAIGEQALLLARTLSDDPRVGETAAAGIVPVRVALARAAMWDVAPLDPVMRDEMDDHVHQRTGLHHDGASDLVLNRLGPSRVSLRATRVDATDLDKPVVLRLFRLEPADAFEGAPRRIPLPFDPGDPSAGFTLADQLIGQTIADSFAGIWAPLAEPVAAPGVLGAGAVDGVTLPPGDYLVQLSWPATGGDSNGVDFVLALVRIPPFCDVQIEWTIPPAELGALLDSMICLPATVTTTTRRADDDDSTPAARATTRRTNARWISRLEVTCGEYLEFLNHPEVFPLVRESFHADRASRLVPRDGGGRRLWPLEEDGTRFRLPPGQLASAPVTCISAFDARHFAVWRQTQVARSSASGLVVRVPVVDELAGGTRYPWGHHAETAFAWVARDRAPDTAADSDDQPWLRFDETPTGIRHLAGSVREWVDLVPATETSEAVNGAFGGSFRSCRRGRPSYTEMAAREELPGDAVADDLGFRIVAEWHPPE